MRRFGFNRNLSPPVAKSPPPGGPYGISYGPEVDKYGYHQPPDRMGPPKPPPDPNRQPSAAELSVERGEGQSAHNGQEIPKGGCLGEADRALGVEDGNAQTMDSSDLYLRLRREARNATDADGRLLDVFGKWSGCMKKAGYDYRSPWDANDDPAFQGAVSAKEIATAQADLRCRTEFNVNGVYFALEVAYQERAIEQNAERVAVLGRVAAHRLGVSRVDAQPAIFVGEIAFTVVGVVDTVDRDQDMLLSVIIPAQTVATVWGAAPASGNPTQLLIETELGAANQVGRRRSRCCPPARRKPRPSSRRIPGRYVTRSPPT